MFSKRLRELRKKRKLTMKEFGAQFGIAESTISGYENSFRFPDIKTIESFADYFNVTVDFLIGRSDSPNFTNGEESFLDDLNLSLEELIEKYNLTVDGKQASEEEIRGAIAWIRANRMVHEIEQKKVHAFEQKNRLIIKPIFYPSVIAVLLLSFLVILLDRQKLSLVVHPLIPRKKRGVILPYTVGKCLLADLLKKARMTQQELSIKTGIPKQQINRYVKNKQVMSYPTAKLIAYTLKCCMEDLYE